MRIGQELLRNEFDRDKIVDEIKRRLTEKKAFKPYITVSREPGSGGKPIAAEVAKKLGFKLYDRRLIEQVAEKMHKPIKLMRDVDEKERSGIMDIVQNMFNPDYVSDETYFRNMCQVLFSLSQKGGVVLVGRGANFIAPKAYGLQVQVVAPYRVRVARAMQYEKMDYSQSRDVIRKISDERQAFVRQYFGKDIHAPKYYDLTINTTFFSIETAADLVIEAYKAKFPGGKPNPEFD